jgi:hypothetical protein
LEVKNEKAKGEYDSQQFQRGFDIRKLEKDGPVRYFLIVEHKADAPDSGRKADVLGAGQVVQNYLGLDLGGHAVLCFLRFKKGRRNATVGFPVGQLSD